MALLQKPTYLVLIASILIGSGCGDPPEKRLRDRIEEARVAAEKGDLSTLEAMMAVDFVDDRGNDRASVLAIVGYYVRIDGGLHIWTRIDEIDLSEPQRARVRLLVALAAGPIESPRDLVQLRAEVHRLTLTFVESDAKEWQLARATRVAASLADVL